MTKKDQENALRLQAVIENAIDGIITIDQNGVIETVNPSAAQIFQYDPRDLIGQKVNILMPAPHNDLHDHYIESYLQTGNAKIIGIGREVKGRRKDGSIFPMRLGISEVTFSDRIIFTGFINDLSAVKKAQEKIIKLNIELEKKNEQLEVLVEERTENLAKVVDQLLQTNSTLKIEIQEREKIEDALRRSERELRQLLEKEKELSELKSRFVSMASHEFRTPLSTILSSIELIEAYTKEEHQPKREKHIYRIKSAVNHLTTILNDFLSLSKLEEGDLSPNYRNMDFSKFWKETYEDIRVMLKHGQTIQYQANMDSMSIRSDKSFLRHILFNLLSNAIKYSPEEKPIECVTSLKDDQLTISITDYGIGIPVEDQKHLFTRFFRAHNVENIKGTGLGLNIVRRYVELLKGNITFESSEGKGTTFTVTIPANFSEYEENISH